jgi:hypothetical protein
MQMNSPLRKKHKRIHYRGSNKYRRLELGNKQLHLPISKLEIIKKTVVTSQTFINVYYTQKYCISMFNFKISIIQKSFQKALLILISV